MPLYNGRGREECYGVVMQILQPCILSRVPSRGNREIKGRMACSGLCLVQANEQAPRSARWTQTKSNIPAYQRQTPIYPRSWRGFSSRALDSL